MRNLFLLLLVPCLVNAGQSIQKVRIPDILPLVVIGSGPAGHTAAQYAGRLGIPTTKICGMEGGLLTQTSSIENYPGVKKVMGQELMNTMLEQTKEAGVTLINDMVDSVDFTEWPYTISLEDGTMYRALSIIITTGATPRKLGIPGEERYWGLGVSTCALCDALFFKGKNVAIVGGGDSAVEEAMQLSPHVASVTIYVRKERMRAGSTMQQKLSGFSNIKSIEYKHAVTQVLGDNEGVTALEVQNLETNEKKVVPYDGLFLAIGHTPNAELFAGQLALTDSGHILVNERNHETSVPGVFAAGDVEDALYRQAIVAAGNGCKAAISAVHFLREAGVTEATLKQLQKFQADESIGIIADRKHPFAGPTK
jgi:thioredoxin reductase (NADPH)